MFSWLGPIATALQAQRQAEALKAAHRAVSVEFCQSRDTPTDGINVEAGGLNYVWRETVIPQVAK